MRRVYCSALALAVAALVPSVSQAQGMDESVKAITDGGIKVAGWKGKVDIAQPGATVEQAKLEKTGDVLHVITGPAISYWNPANKASGDYTVKGLFDEPKYMNLNNHPHPYGVFIGGNDLDTDHYSLLYCEAYGTGRYIVRGFSDGKPFSVVARPVANDAVHKASGPGTDVSQNIGLTVKGNAVSCNINGTDVATFPKDSVVMAGRLKSLDGAYGIRFAHNTEGTVSGFALTKP